MTSIVPFDQFHIQHDVVSDCAWIVRLSDGAAFANVNALSQMCEVDHQTISVAVNNVEKRPKGLQGLDFKPAVRIENQSFPTMPYLAIPASVCFDVLYYYAHEARGHENRLNAKRLFREMGIAGTNVFITKMAGYNLKPTLKEEPKQILPVFAPTEERVSMALDNRERFEKLYGKPNPAMEQAFKDDLLDIMTHGKALLASKENWLGVVNYAEMYMGKKVPLKGDHYRGHLGAWVRCFYPELSDRQEQRLCQETQQKIWVYPCHDSEVEKTLTKAIAEFFENEKPSQQLKQAGWFTKK